MSARSKYPNLIDLPHHTSEKHPRMSDQNRAAQFTPFAALTGFDSVIGEAGRITDERPILTDAERDRIDFLLRLACDLRVDVTVGYFIPDRHKKGGAVLSAAGRILGFGGTDRTVILRGASPIPFDDILFVEGAFLDNIEY